jgi:predicted O-methyltransferase YrrM
MDTRRVTGAGAEPPGTAAARNPVSRDARPRAISRRPQRLERSLFRLRYKLWFNGKQFTTDWTSAHFAMWVRVLAPLRNEPLRILEIGSWEGRSAVFFLNFFSRSTIVCIDTFSGSAQEQAFKKLTQELRGAEARFDSNLAPFQDRVEKIKSESGPALARLAAQDRQFDLAYIDGSHLRDDVMADSLGVWRLLARGGIVIWDDYTWEINLPPEQRPQPAIDAFLDEHQGRYHLLAKTEQVIIERVD